MYYPCSENKDADQLRGNREADLRLCFRPCKLLVFSRTGSFLCNIYPLMPYIYIAKRVCRSIPIILILDPKHRLWVLFRTASARRF